MLYCSVERSDNHTHVLRGISCSMQVNNNAFRTLYQKSHSVKWQSRRVVSCLLLPLWRITLEVLGFDARRHQRYKVCRATIESVFAHSYIQVSICSPLRRGQYISNMPLLFSNFLPFLAMTPVCLGPNLLSGTRSLSSSHISLMSKREAQLSILEHIPFSYCQIHDYNIVNINPIDYTSLYFI